MKRQVSLEEISDGRLYGRHDMVRVGCGGCRGCSQCCRGMGNSAILDPLDIVRLTQGTGLPFEELLADKIELNVVDGIILPNLAMRQTEFEPARSGNPSAEGQDVRSFPFEKEDPDTGSEKEEACGFLDGQGRCSIHSFRPGVCRLFPLGRYYLPGRESGGSDSGAAVLDGETAHEQDRMASDSYGASAFRYFLQVHECPALNKTKVRVEKWLEQPELPRYESYILKWHNFLDRMEALVAREMKKKADDTVKTINLYLLQTFFVKPYDPDRDFYTEFEERLAAMENAVSFGAG